MKRLLFICFCIGLLAHPAYTYEKCVALGGKNFSYGTPETTCTTDWLSARADWTATCTTTYRRLTPDPDDNYSATEQVTTPSFTVRGVAGCSKSGGTAYTTTTDILTTLTTASDENNNKCWCKMVTPVVSKWVYIRSYEHIGSCAKSCAYRCEEAMANNATFRDTLFTSSLTD